MLSAINADGEKVKSSLKVSVSESGASDNTMVVNGLESGDLSKAIVHASLEQSTIIQSLAQNKVKAKEISPHTESTRIRPIEKPVSLNYSLANKKLNSILYNVYDITDADFSNGECLVPLDCVGKMLVDAKISRSLPGNHLLQVLVNSIFDYFGLSVDQHL